MLENFVSKRRNGDYGRPVDPDFRDYPAPYLNAAISEFKKRNGSVIVEIGSMRMAMNHPIERTDFECCCDGHSTLFFALTGAEFYSIDIDPNANQTARNALKEKGLPTDNILCMDGLEFLKGFKKNIDLIFFDAWDVDLADSEDKHLEAYEIAKFLLHEESLILIDDTDVFRNEYGQVVFGNGRSGKGAKIIPAAERDGWHVQFSGRQTLLSRY